MKKGDVVYWFRFTLGGELKWYEAKIRQWDWGKDVADVTIKKKFYDTSSLPGDVAGRHKIDKSELWTTQMLINNKKKIFRMIFTVLEKK